MSYSYIACTVLLTVYGQLVIKWQVLAAGAFPEAPGEKMLHDVDAPRDLKYNGHAFDAVYTFDRSAIEAYRQLRMQDVRWLPLAMSPATSIA